jgi:hypothetical protein
MAMLAKASSNLTDLPIFTENTKGLNLAAVKLTTVQVTKPLL